MIMEGVFHSAITQIEMFTFEVHNVNTIHFTLLEGAFEHFFILVKDPAKTIRAMFSYKTRCKSYCLARDTVASDNYTLAGELANGIWTIELIRTYPIKGGFKLDVSFDLGHVAQLGINPLETSHQKLFDNRKGWYQGDFHMHSAFSDGRVSLQEVAYAAKDKQLDFISMSEHSTLTTKFPQSAMLVLPATEITWDDEGHYNVHGLHAIPDYAHFIKRTKTKNEALDTMFKSFNKQGCLLSINHPFPREWKLRHDYDIRSFQLLEVVNAPHLIDKEVDNEKAIHFFDYLWLHGHRLFGVGGSDAHKRNYFETYPIAIPKTKVYCDGLSIDHILKAMRKGNSYIEINETFELNFHRLDDLKQSILPGEFIEGPVLLEARCQSHVRWQIIRNGRMMFEDTGKYFTHEIDIKDDEFYRLQARTPDGELALFVNPLWHSNKTAECFQFQTILEGFNTEIE